ncbi:MAG: TetR/AcrR family transcriptional regulator [Sandaracinaceae bacterium]|nr:TetR/AcrR family transcriptional regulator [Sandaracinaceae bacterium]
MRKGEIGKQKLVDAAARLLQRQGYSATGLSQIVEESGAPRGSLYFYFPGGKEELACAALEAAGAAWKDRLRAVIDAAPDPARAVVAVCDALAGDLIESGFEDGCPLATVGLEASSSSRAVRRTVAAHYESWIALVRDRWIALGVEPESAARAATFTLSAIEGALLLAKVRRDVAPLREAGAFLAALVPRSPSRAARSSRQTALRTGPETRRQTSRRPT